MRFEAEPDTLPVGDAYFLFDNGKAGNYPELMKPFAGMEKTVKQYVVYKEEMSVHKRFKRVQGCAAFQLHEALHIVTGQVFAIPSKSFQDYHGSTAGSMIGPVVMPSPEQIWSLPWKLKKELYGTANLVPVGGPIGKEIVDFSGGPRTNDQVESAFRHSYPVSFYLEILQAFPIANVIDLTPGEGALAFAAHQRNIKYWGLTFNERHLSLLRERLDVLCLQCMLEEGHPLYDPVALAAVKAGVPQPKKPDPKPKAAPKKTTRKRTADGQPVDPQPDKPEADGDADDFSCDDLEPGA